MNLLSVSLHDVPELKKKLVNVRVKAEKLVNKIDLLVILDKSGSMSGQPIEAAKNGIKLIFQAHDVVFSNCTLIAFNDGVSVSTVNKENVDRTMNSIKAGGGTSFIPVFRQIRDCLKYFHNDLVIVFFTDGCGTYTKQEIDAVASAIKQSKLNCITHTIGFSAEHDAALLSQLTMIGTVPGSFQFVQRSADIKQSIEKVVEKIEGKNLFASLLLPTGKDKLKMCLNPTDTLNEFEGDLLVDDFTDETKIEIILDNKSIQVDNVIVEKDSITKLLKCINFQILEYTNLISSNNGKTDRAKLQDIKKRCESFNQILNRCKTNSNSNNYSVEDKKQLKTSILEIETLINQFHSNILSSALAGTLTNEKIASLNDLAYGIIGKKSLKIKLDKRIEENIEMFDNLDKIIKNTVTSIKFQDLSEKDLDATCILSCMNYIEALKNFDCMCIALDIERPEAAIADPTRVIIKSIHPSMITADSFLDSVQHALNNDDDHEALHGGFKKNANAKLFSGQGRENVTGALPLFINEVHWSVARHKMKPLVGWLSTLNILGYAYSQVTAIPFLVLAKAIQDYCNEKTDFRKHVYELVLDTCMRIYRESVPIKETIFDENKSIKFLNDPLQRTIDCVPNLHLFLTYLHCAVQNNDIELDEKQIELLQKYTFEEDHRRKQTLVFSFYDPDNVNVGPLLYEFLGVDEAEDVKDAIVPVKERAKEMYAKVKDLVKQFKRAEDVDEPTVKLLIEMQPIEMNDLISLIDSTKSKNAPRTNNKSVDDIINKFDSLSKNIIPSLNTLIKTLKTKNIEDAHGTVLKFDLESLTNAQKLGIIVQNLFGIKNSDRRFYNTQGFYKDPFENPNEIIAREYHKIVNEGIRDKCGSIRSQCVHLFSDIIYKNQPYYFYSDTVALALSEFFQSIPGFCDYMSNY